MKKEIHNSFTKKDLTAMAIGSFIAGVIVFTVAFNIPLWKIAVVIGVIALLVFVLFLYTAGRMLQITDKEGGQK